MISTKGGNLEPERGNKRIFIKRGGQLIKKKTQQNHGSQLKDQDLLKAANSRFKSPLRMGDCGGIEKAKGGRQPGLVDTGP